MISAVGNKRSARGFTLIELMVVMVVLALTSAVVLSALPRSDSEAMQAARLFALSAEQLADAAVMDGRPRGLSVTGDGLDTYVFVDGEWQFSGTGQAGRLPDDVFLELTPTDDFGLEPEEDEADLVFRSRDGAAREEEEETEFPQVVYNPTGEATGYSLQVEGRRQAVRVTGQPDGRIEVGDAVSR